MPTHEFKPPQCACGNANGWEVEKAEKTPLYTVTQWHCSACGRPACYVKHEGGNAFIISSKFSNQLPPEILDYVKGPLLATFNRNYEVLNNLRNAYEQKRYAEICASFRVLPSRTWATIPTDIMSKMEPALACVYGEPEWLTPSGYKPLQPPKLPALTHGSTLIVEEPKKGTKKVSWKSLK